jgi:hypothetical protein
VLATDLARDERYSFDSLAETRKLAPYGRPGLYRTDSDQFSSTCLALAVN